MTPAELEAIRGRDAAARVSPCYGSLSTVEIDHRALLAHVDEQEERLDGYSAMCAEQEQVAAQAAHLLAHQQARGIEGADAVRRVPGLTSWLDDLRRCLRMYEEAWTRELHAAGARIPAKASGTVDELVAGTKDLGAQRDALRAENQRLRAALERVREICDESLPHSGLTISDTSAVQAIAALGEEVRDDA